MTTIKNHVSAKFQTIVFSLACFILIFLLYKPLYRFTSYDQKPDNLSGAPQQSNPALIRTGLHINSFSKVDILKNDFVFEGELWFEFDPSKISIEELEKFDIDHGQILEKSKPIISSHDGKTVAQYFIRANFKTNLNYKAFPLDNHVIYITITNRFVSADKVVFEPVVVKSITKKDLLTSLCALNDISVQAGYVTSTLPLAHATIENHSPQLIFGIKCNHVDLRHFLNIFLPLLLIFFFTLFAFSLDFHEHGTMVPTMAAAGVPALLAYRFVIEAISPDVDYFMLSDYLFFLFLFLNFAIFIAIVAAVHASERTKQLTIIGLYLVMLVCCAILFNWIL